MAERGGVWAAPVVGLFLAAAVVSGAAAKAPDLGKCQIVQLAQLSVMGQPLRPAVQARIDGHPVVLALDTGSFTSLIFPPGLKATGLKPGAVVAYGYGFGGRSKLSIVTADTLDVGGLIGRRAQFLAPETAARFDIDGVLGATVLLQADLELDLPGRTLRFMRPHNCAGDAVVYWRQPYAVLPLEGPAEQRLMVDVLVNGHRVRAEIDSGSPRSSIDTETARSVGVVLAAADAAAGPTMGGIGAGVVPTTLGKLESFAFGDEVIHNTDIIVGAINAHDKEAQIGSHIASNVSEDSPEMFLGADFLRAHRVYIAESQRKIYISYEGGRVFDIRDLKKTDRTAPAVDANAPKPTPTKPPGGARVDPRARPGDW